MGRKTESAKPPSPCIKVCTYDPDDQGRCVGCAMTKCEKKAFKRIDDRASRRAFFEVMAARLRARGRFERWAQMHLRRCAKKGREPILDLADLTSADLT